MDKRDARLLKAITDLETGGPEKLHETTDIPVLTIYYRLSNLEGDGVIENDLYDIDLEAFELDVTAVVEVLTDYSGSCEEVGSKPLEVEGATRLYFTMGETGSIVVVHFADSDHVERLIGDFEATPEVERTSSTSVISSMRDNHRAFQGYAPETLLDELGIRD